MSVSCRFAASRAWRAAISAVSALATIGGVGDFTASSDGLLEKPCNGALPLSPIDPPDPLGPPSVDDIMFFLAQPPRASIPTNANIAAALMCLVCPVRLLIRLFSICPPALILPNPALTSMLAPMGHG